MKGSALKGLYIDELRDIYNAENQLTKALPKMGKAATSKDRGGFEEHLKQTEGHVKRLEQILRNLAEGPPGKKCKGMERRFYGCVRTYAKLLGESGAPRC